MSDDERDDLHCFGFCDGWCPGIDHLPRPVYWGLLAVAIGVILLAGFVL